MESVAVVQKCRLCLCDDDQLISIFDVSGRHGFIAADVISDILHLDVGRTDKYPSYICNYCLDKLTEVKHFMIQCYNSKIIFDNDLVPRVCGLKRRRSTVPLGPDLHKQKRVQNDKNTNVEVEITPFPRQPEEILPDRRNDIEMTPRPRTQVEIHPSTRQPVDSVTFPRVEQAAERYEQTFPTQECQNQPEMPPTEIPVSLEQRESDPLQFDEGKDVQKQDVPFRSYNPEFQAEQSRNRNFASVSRQETPVIKQEQTEPETQEVEVFEHPTLSAVPVFEESNLKAEPNVPEPQEEESQIVEVEDRIGAGTPARLSGWHFPEKNAPSGRRHHMAKRCIVCLSKRRRKETIFSCKKCSVALCAAPCFKVYHTKLDYTEDDDSEDRQGSS